VEFQLLGTLRVFSADGSEVIVAARKVRTVLAYLLVHRSQTVSVDRVVDALLQERPPSSSVNFVHGYVRDLRRVLGPEVISTVPGGYRLDGDGCLIDADRFDELARAHHYREALALWHGPVLVEWADEPWPSTSCVWFPC
jgi:DNA-binding SARP family transcriptional activator